MATVAQALAEELKNAGIDTVFGLPGGENIAIVDALQGLEIEFVLVHHEATGAYMASASARLTGKPSACLTTLGPGAANAVAGVAHAFLDRAPVLFISAQTPEKMRPLHTHQYLNLQAMFEPITKGSFQLKADAVRRSLQTAIQLCANPRPGPVHVALSADEANLAAETERVSPVVHRAPMLNDLQKAKTLITSFHRPVILVGLGYRNVSDQNVLVKFAEGINAPVIQTPKAKGVVDARHSLSAGTIGLTPEDRVYEILGEADGVVALGFDVVELVKVWRHPAPLVWIAPWGNTDPQIPAAAELVGDVEAILQMFGELHAEARPGWGVERVAALVQKQAKPVVVISKPKRVAPQSVLRVVREIVLENAIVTTDVGSHKILAALEWPAYIPNSFLLSNGLSCMGYGLPAAIAASRLYPERQVVCFTGDAGLLMALGELAQLRKVRAALLIVVFNDNALDLIRAKQLRAKLEPRGTEFLGPAWELVAAAFGLGYAQVGDERGCKQEVQQALQSKKPTIIDALIDPGAYPTSAGKHG